jgi:hypothetical protein
LADKVRFIGEGSESASSPVSAGKFKKHRRAHREYVWLKEWKIVSRFPTGCRALDAEDIEFDIYKETCKMMELSCMKMLPGEEVQAGGVHLSWQLKRQANSSAN